MGLILESVDKMFGPQYAVQDVNFTVQEGEVFGFLGPNGAGKTTSMRMMLDIIKPDSGQITWRGKEVSLEMAKTFGYLPEERGLYPKMQVLEQMRFFARLRGLSNADAEGQITYWSERFQLGDLMKKKATELSKGNQQKVQFILAILHRPDLLILDEPFSGLDPVNVELLKAAFLDLANEGRTIVFSSHRMEHVEELCHSLCIIKRGQIIAQGPIDVIKRATGRQILRLSLAGRLDFLQKFSVEYTVQSKEEAGKTSWETTEFDLPAGVDPQNVLQEALLHGQVRRFEIGDPSLNDVFISLVGGNAS